MSSIDQHGSLAHGCIGYRPAITVPSGIEAGVRHKLNMLPSITAPLLSWSVPVASFAIGAVATTLFWRFVLRSEKQVWQGKLEQSKLALRMAQDRSTQARMQIAQLTRSLNQLNADQAVLARRQANWARVESVLVPDRGNEPANSQRSAGGAHTRPAHHDDFAETLPFWELEGNQRY